MGYSWTRAIRGSSTRGLNWQQGDTPTRGRSIHKNYSRRISLSSTFDGVPRPNSSTYFRAREDTSRGSTPHRNHTWLTNLQQISSPGPRSPQRSQDGISSDDQATSDAAIEKSMGVTSARGIEKGRKPATMWRLPRVKRPHHTRQVFPTPY